MCCPLLMVAEPGGIPRGATNINRTFCRQLGVLLASFNNILLEIINVCLSVKNPRIQNQAESLLSVDMIFILLEFEPLDSIEIFIIFLSYVA